MSIFVVRSILQLPTLASAFRAYEYSETKTACYICYFRYFLKEMEITFEVLTFGGSVLSRGRYFGPGFANNNKLLHGCVFLIIKT